MSITNYEIESRSDFLTGMYLTASIPESELDENALYTIQGDCPDFILPFNYKKVNGSVEFTYKVGTLCKLQYFFGNISHTEYICLWRGLLSPLLECRDWFMNPCSFVLDTEYLYYDKKKKTPAYIYIPSVNGCSAAEAFSEMAAEVARSIKVSDPVLENKVLRSVLSDFNPNDFLKMLIEYAGQSEKQMPEPEKDADIGDADTDGPQTDALAETEEDTSEKHSISKTREKIPAALKIFAGKSKKSNETKRNGFKNTLPAVPAAGAVPESGDVSGNTQEIKTLVSGTGFRCIGRAQYPQVIEVNIADGGIFTIGRHDINAGVKKSCFEFEAKTKAVSRRHAAVERSGEVYRIVDLSSSAGTFVGDRKLPPNTPVELKNGSHVSFGNLGADYVWEIG